MGRIPIKRMDRECQELVNRVYEAYASDKGNPYTITTTNKPRYYLGMSGIGRPCKRALWYGFRGFTPKPFEGRVKGLFELGYHIEHIQSYWMERAGYSITNKQASYQDHEGYFKGHPDGIIKGISIK